MIAPYLMISGLLDTMWAQQDQTNALTIYHK